ncbi:MAG: hypothetical protein ACJ8AJ_03540 [Gemmatimonadaceae bacterium]
MSHLSEDQLDQIIAAERRRDDAPLNEWRTIAARAREEGLIRESRSSRLWASGQPWMQAAAAVLVLIGGIAIGRLTIALPGDGQNQLASVSVGDGNPTSPAGVANNRPNEPARITFASVEEAATTLDRAVEDYQRASQFLAANNAPVETRDSTSIYTARAAALDKIVDATERALQTAPHDPVINQYYLATMGARVATQQMVARPVALRGF